MRVNEDLVGEVGAALKAEAAAKRENAAVVAANRELFEEAQRLSDEEAGWREEREKFQREIAALREQVEDIERKVVSVGERETGAREAAARVEAELSEEVREGRQERERLQESNRRLGEKAEAMRARVQSLEEEKESLSRRREAAAGESMQLMVDADEQARRFRTKAAEMGRELQVSRDRGAEMERECARLRTALAQRGGACGASGAREGAGCAGAGGANSDDYASLLEKNKNLTLWREQLVEKNKLLLEENAKLRKKCQNLEDLVNEEETDIGDVLELIRNMQGGPPGHGHGHGHGVGVGVGLPGSSPGQKTSPKSGVVGPISKFRDLRL